MEDKLLNEILSTLKDLQNDMSAVKNSTSVLQIEVADINKGMSDLKHEVDDVKAKGVNTEKVIADTNREVSDLLSDIKYSLKDIHNLYINVRSNESKLNSLSLSFTKLEDMICVKLSHINACVGELINSNRDSSFKISKILAAVERLLNKSSYSFSSKTTNEEVVKNLAYRLSVLEEKVKSLM